MPTRDKPMIITAFTYGLLEGELFMNLVGRKFLNSMEMIWKINRFLRKKAKSTEKARMEGKTTILTKRKVGANRWSNN